MIESLSETATSRMVAAWDSELDRCVAIRLIGERDADDAVRARLLDDARALARLAHPNVVRVQEVGEHEGAIFTAMELVCRGCHDAALDRDRRVALQRRPRASTACDCMRLVRGTPPAVDRRMGRTGLAVVLALIPSAMGLVACDEKNPDDGVASDGDVDDDDDDEDDDADPDDGEDPADDEPADDNPPDDEPDDDEPDEPPPPPPEPKPDAAYPCDDTMWGGTACTTDDGLEGTSFCFLQDGVPFETPCSTDEQECQPGDNEDYGCMGSICFWNGDHFERYSWSEDDCETPLVVQLDGASTSFMPAIATPFDMSSDGTCTTTDWPTSPWLALDRDGDGVITSGAELFGSATKMSTGGYAQHGFAALAELDDNRDGRIDAQDSSFAKLVLWSDLDDDRMGTAAELRRLADAQLVSIDLAFERQASCDGFGNCGYERAAFEYHTAEGATAVGEIVDVRLQCR